MEEEFIEYQANKIRQLSGFTNDLLRLSSTEDKTNSVTLNMFLFDEYLQKQ